MNYYFKDKEAKSEFIKRNVKEIACRLEEVADLKKLSADGSGIDAIQYCNVIDFLEKQKNKLQKLIEVYEMDSAAALDEKDFSIVNALICYSDLVKKA